MGKEVEISALIMCFIYKLLLTQLLIMILVGCVILQRMYQDANLLSFGDILIVYDDVKYQ